jgi:cytochrome oxidase Cu insertion factor (SCO1/SenC/PrrC family)
MTAARRSLLVVASLFLCGSVAAAEQPSAAQMMDDLMYGRGSVGGPFTLTDQTGKQRSDTDFRGKLMMVYFGYTYCPDICQTDLMAITQALDVLGPAAEDVQPVFITIDPERDRKVLAEYVSAFHHSLVGLTGSPEQIRRVANSYKAFYVRVPAKRSGDYSIDHAGVIYLMGRNGEYLGFMPPQTNPDRLVEILRKNLARCGNPSFVGMDKCAR